jgi:hypothetical protein
MICIGSIYTEITSHWREWKGCVISHAEMKRGEILGKRRKDEQSGEMNDTGRALMRSRSLHIWPALTSSGRYDRGNPGLIFCASVLCIMCLKLTYNSDMGEIPQQIWVKFGIKYLTRIGTKTWWVNLIFQTLLATCFKLVSCFAYSSALKREAACSSEMSVDFRRTTRHYIPEDRALRNHRCENFKSCIQNKWSWPSTRYCPGICMEELRNPRERSVRIVGVPAEIRTGNLHDSS